MRELKNVVHRAYILAEDDIGSECLPNELGGRRPSNGNGAVAAAVPLPAVSNAEMGTTLMVRVGSSVAEVEQQLILATLEACSGNKQKTAEVLGVSLKTIYNRLNAYRETRAA